MQPTEQSCCLPNGICIPVDEPICCLQQGGVPQGGEPACEGDADGDGIDGICGDVCLGFDDRIDDDNDGIPDCLQTIPTVSTWGMIVLALLVLVGAKVRIWENGRYAKSVG
ncbi:MAG: IPTL-CTERM sorting domain-containing protein [Planctomycetota bacterium]